MLIPYMGASLIVAVTTLTFTVLKIAGTITWDWLWVLSPHVGSVVVAFSHTGRRRNSHTYAGVLNATVGMLRLIGYSDSLIIDMIGETYFDRDMLGDLDAATDEAINEYIASRDASDKRLDDLNDYPEI